MEGINFFGKIIYQPLLCTTMIAVTHIHHHHTVAAG
jgi:hypothetical protein